MDSIYRVRTIQGNRIADLTGILNEAKERIGNARRQAYQHAGDWSLFWSGIFPEALRKLSAGSTRDHFVDYCSQGKRAYQIAATLQTTDQEAPSGEILSKLSVQFDLCAYGLREVRRLWDEDKIIETVIL